nr:glutamine amidotransferase [Pirellulaceae bacterium]
VERMMPGDMPDFDPGMRMALAGFNRVTEAAVKHMIIISDGDPTPPGFMTLAGFRQAGVKISTVAVGTHGPAGHTTLQNIANATGGQYYVVTNPKALPRIFQIEARRVARPLVKDLDDVPPVIDYPHEMLQGIDAPLPPLKGFVMTTVKANPLVEVALVSPDPPTPENAAVLAAWNYGLGRSVAFTTDAGKRWAQAWTDWENYDKFFSQMVRWSMRPVNDEGKYTIATDIRDGKVRVVVTALDKDDEFQNFLNMAATVVDPELDDFEVGIRQIAPGRYQGEFDADKAGSYFVTISPGPGKAPILAGVNVPYSSEFREFQTNLPMLESLAAMTPKEGQPGQVADADLAPDQFETLLSFDTFREGLRRAVSRQDIWPIVLLIVAGVFWGDVFIRRVTVHFYWVVPAARWLIARLMRRQAEATADVVIERLRSQKAAIGQQIDERRAAARFEPQMDEAAGGPLPDDVLRDAAVPTPQTPPRPREETTVSGEQDSSYTARLLEAKKKAWKEKKE